MTPDLDWLLAPRSGRWFLDTVWQTRPTLVATGRPGHFDGLFSKAAVEHILEFAQPRHPSLRITSVGEPAPTDIPLRPDGRIDIDKVRRLYAAGKTLILNNVEDVHADVALLARRLETDLGARVQINAYLTPPGAQGFAAHYDTHDVLVAHIAGEKIWRIQGAEAACPLHELTDGDPRLRSTAEPPWQPRLVPGDLLYIPRGWIHEAVTQTSASLHLTISIHPPLAVDLLQAALDGLVRRYAGMRAALPPGPLAGQRQRLAPLFEELVARFGAEAQLDDAIASIDDQLLRRGRTGGEGRLFDDAEALAQLSGSSWLERRQHLPCRLVPEADGGMGVQFLNSLIKGPPEFATALAFVADSIVPFRVDALPGLPPTHQLVLANSLVGDGLCRLAGPPAEAGRQTRQPPRLVSA